MAQVGSLFASLTLEDKSFLVALKRSQDATAKSTAAIQSRLDSLHSGFKALASAGIVVAFQQAASRALDYASSLGEVSQQLGVTTRELQIYRYAASQAGQSQEELDGALGKLTRTIGEAAAGSKAQAGTFVELGLAVQDANGRIYTAGELMPRIADAIAKIEDPAKRARLEVDLFGRAGQKLDPLLTSGSAGLKQFADAAEKAGVVLSDELVAGADDAADRMAALQQEFDAKFAKNVLTHADAYATLARRLLDAAGGAAEFASKYQSATLVLGGAAIGGRLFGPLGALAGGGAGLAGALYDKLNNPGARMSDTQLRGRMREIAFKLRDHRQYGGEARAELVREGGLLHAESQRRMAARSQSATSTAAVGDGALPSIGGSGRARGGRGGSDRAASRDAANREQYRDDLDRLAEREFGLRGQLTSSLEEQADLERRRLALDAASFERDIADRQRQGELSTAEAKRLQAAYNFNRTLDEELIDQRLAADKAQETARTRDERASLQSELLRGELDGARTVAEQRRIQLKLIDIEYDRLRASFEAVLALKSSSAAEKDLARQKLAALDTLRASDQAKIERSTRSPVAAYLDTLPRDAGELNEAYEKIAADGLQSLNDGLALAITQSENLGDVLHRVMGQIVADLARIAVQRFVTQPLVNALFGGASLFDAGPARAAANSALDALGTSFSGFRASGGPVRTGQSYIVGELGPELFVPSGSGRIVANDQLGHGAGPYFDLRGAVLTADLLRQMNAIGDASSFRGAALGSAGAQAALVKRQSRRVG